ncbi:CDP-glycerol glycerophosphotransferase family protein [Streptomyces netropsis]|uniref:bifunctional glycosyltransferase/CDP-glycerol:glycerophosphate glycerophosphotransferase n=1 Tax=Streptomyces netropsis TaxID=55404 RepID=UPI003789ECD5
MAPRRTERGDIASTDTRRPMVSTAARGAPHFHSRHGCTRVSPLATCRWQRLGGSSTGRWLMLYGRSATEGEAIVEITVIVVVYNDAERLPAAVRSVLGQTLRSVEVVIVDDCSRDHSFEMARKLAADHPDRVRAFRLPRNSGAGGEPRNVGVQHATGRYVMFLDSDDLLERNACRNLLEAAERTRSDIVSGLCVRLYKDRRSQKREEWCPWIYPVTRTLESVTEFPDLFVWDTLSTNKCYRRDFLLANGLRFPEGMFYEDLLFSAAAYLAAGRITLIPNQVYFWHVHERAVERSVTNSRHDIINYVHRLEMHRRIDALLEERALTSLKFAKDVKFLKHDLVLYLRDLPFRDKIFRREFAELSRAYLATLDPGAFAQARPVQAICAYLLQQDDWTRLLAAVDTLIHPAKVSSPLAERDGRIYWCSEYLDDEFARGVLDVTNLGYHTRPLRRVCLRNQLCDFAGTHDSLRMAGRITNPLGLISADAVITGELLFSARHSLRSFSFPVQSFRHDGESIHWEAAVNLAAGLRPLGIIDPVWEVRLALDVGQQRTMTRITAGDADLAHCHLPVRPRLTRLAADHLEPQVSAKGHLVFRLVTKGRTGQRVQKLIDPCMRGTPGTLARSSVRKALLLHKTLTSEGAKLRLYHKVFSRLPVKKRTVVFESHLGRQYSDSPRVIYEEMRRQSLKFEAVWAYHNSPEGFPEDAVLVRRWSLPYLYALARAGFWVDNQSYPLRLAKRPGTTYIQTWHGSALKRMGFDQPNLKAATRQEQQKQQIALARFDHFLVRSEYDVHTLAKAFRLQEKTLLRMGYPRNDALVRTRQREALSGQRFRSQLARELRIPDDTTVLLYAPTFRTADSRHGHFEMPFNVERFAEEFGDRHLLLVRAHYLNHVVLPPTVHSRVIDVSAQHDVTPLLELADALITDYSSVMFDYALLDRPILFFTYDYEEYLRTGPGTYFDPGHAGTRPRVRH